MAFERFGLCRSLSRSLKDLGFTEPTDFQTKSIPALLKGKDLLGVASTGTGKTAAYLLPVMQKVITGHGQGTQAIVLVPTKELAQRVNDHLMAFAKYATIKSATIFSGVSYAPQKAALDKQPEFLIATPQRLAQHVQRGNVNFEKVTHVVVDELDKILDSGERDQLIDVLEICPANAQFMLFASRLDDQTSDFAEDALQEPVKVISEKKRKIPRVLKHAIYPVTESEKTGLCRHLADDIGAERTLIFTRTQVRADRLFKELRAADIPAVRIHGQRDEAKRERSLEDFRNGTTPVLIITDLSGGILADEKVTLLINFDIPTASENYLNRIATAKLSGVDAEVITLVSENDKMMIAQIEQLLDASLVRRYAPNFAYKKKIEIGKVRLKQAPGRRETEVEEWKESLGEDAEGRSRRDRRKDGRSDSKRDDKRRGSSKREDSRGKPEEKKPREEAPPTPAPVKQEQQPEEQAAAAEGEKASRRRRRKKRSPEEQAAAPAVEVREKREEPKAEEKEKPAKKERTRRSSSRTADKQENGGRTQQKEETPDPSKMTAYEKMLYYTKGPGARKSPPPAQHSNNSNDRSSKNGNGLPTPRASRRGNSRNR